MRKSGLRIGRAGKKGFGVFATVEIPEETIVIRYRGRARWIWDIPHYMWDHCLQVDYDRYVVPARDSPGWFVNHSCEPNCAVNGEREIITLRRIWKGEELTFDYSTNVGWDGFEMACSCGASGCRGTIRSYAEISEALRERYDRRVSAYLLETRDGS